MKKIFIFLFVLLSFNCYAQNKFQLDTLEVDSTINNQVEFLSKSGIKEIIVVRKELNMVFILYKDEYGLKMLKSTKSSKKLIFKKGIKFAKGVNYFDEIMSRTTTGETLSYRDCIENVHFFKLLQFKVLKDSIIQVILMTSDCSNKKELLSYFKLYSILK